MHDGQPEQLSVVRPITLKVSSDGQTVRVGFPSPYPLFYCPVGIQLRAQITSPAPISSNGGFTATVVDKLNPEPAVPVKQIVTGRFSGHTVTGTIRTKAGNCGGTATFAAKAG
jgi:hypothetical protein